MLKKIIIVLLISFIVLILPMIVIVSAAIESTAKVMACVTDEQIQHIDVLSCKIIQNQLSMNIESEEVDNGFVTLIGWANAADSAAEPDRYRVGFLADTKIYPAEMSARDDVKEALQLNGNMAGFKVKVPSSEKGDICIIDIESQIIYVQNNTSDNNVESQEKNITDEIDVTGYEEVKGQITINIETRESSNGYTRISGWACAADSVLDSIRYRIGYKVNTRVYCAEVNERDDVEEVLHLKGNMAGFTITVPDSPEGAICIIDTELLIIYV